MIFFLTFLTLLSYSSYAESNWESSHTLQVIVSDVPPLSYLAEGKLTGFNVDILKQIEKESHLKMNFSLYPHARIHKSLESGEPDFTIILKKICDSYKNTYEYYEPFYNLRPSILLKRTVDPMKKDIRIGRGRGMCTNLSLNFVKKEMVVEVSNLDQAFKMLQVDRLDGVCGIEPVIKYNLKQNKFLNEELVLYKTQERISDFDTVICAKKSLPIKIRKLLQSAARKVIVPDFNKFI
jgi:ABC-type amino acid transport substrate-binding protein